MVKEYGGKFVEIDVRSRYEIFGERDAEGVVKRGGKRRYRWRLRASNGEVVCASEGYINKRDCELAVVRWRQWAAEGLGLVRYLDAIPPSGDTSKWRNPFHNIEEVGHE